MSTVKKTIVPVLLSTVWISVNEFIRNQLVLQNYWTDHYNNLGITFPAEPVNGAVWGIWSLLFAVAILIISKRFSLRDTTLLSWLVGFVLMWVVIGNMGVLPTGILIFAIPWSLVEAFGAAYISHYFTKPRA
ncbi:MAG TPA: hypothetical protein PK511_00585 [Chitinophagales bacterium]|nr:hypothetical protein [Chitinophagales bacterium]HMU70357.1 hypothetical protein [Chitinophagales bacterium]HMX03175.1 hypothetical protein [Chitinophagales bacterium]HMZ89728.1 hypothetical protein [Chitinophagales bacterium]HNA56505.1 hypothetical protein [Chitinophagales bacterium]